MHPYERNQKKKKSEEKSTEIHRSVIVLVEWLRHHSEK
jgi:hypothetical protein